MEKRDFRIAEPTREKIKIFKEVFPSDESIDLLYREASLLAFTYNNELKKEGKAEGFVSPGKLPSYLSDCPFCPHRGFPAGLLHKAHRNGDG